MLVPGVNPFVEMGMGVRRPALTDHAKQGVRQPCPESSIVHIRCRYVSASHMNIAFAPHGPLCSIRRIIGYFLIRVVCLLTCNPDEILSDDANELLINSVMLPSPELGNLPEIESMIRSASSTVPGRDSLGKFVLSEDYIGKLIPLLEIAEDLESLDNLHRLCNIMKMMILLNDTLIIEHIVLDEVVLGVVGILECKLGSGRGNAWQLH